MESLNLFAVVNQNLMLCNTFLDSFRLDKSLKRKLIIKDKITNQMDFGLLKILFYNKNI